MPIELKNRKLYEILRDQKVVIQKAAPLSSSNSFFVYMFLTEGELLALSNALKTNPTPVGSNVLNYLNHAITEAKTDLK